MNELYWISIIGKLNILFWIGFAVSIFSILINGSMHFRLGNLK